MDAEAPKVGSDPSRTILYAQVRDGKPQMSIDEENRLRPLNWPDSGGKVYLGDIAQAALRALGPHDPPRFEEMPAFDEQRWVLVSRANELSMVITSTAYWGFGLFKTCFMNRIELRGPYGLRARCVHDIVASLGHNPWEPARVSKFESATGSQLAKHRVAWEELVSRASEEMSEEIGEIEDSLRRLRGTDDSVKGILDSAEEALDEARMALADRNAPAVERALGRAYSAIVEADPSTEVLSSEALATEDLLDQIPLVDLSEEE
tara:strand:+ start:60 stop:848 length:789 start_codon:yes stop_codon:yes gene_type:complete